MVKQRRHIMEYRNKAIKQRYVHARCRLNYIRNAIDASENYLSSLYSITSDKSLTCVLEREVNVMKGQVKRREHDLISAHSMLSSKRCNRKRKMSIRMKDNVIRKAISRRRKQRVSRLSQCKPDSSNHPMGDVVGDHNTNKSLFNSDSDFDSDSSVDSELEDETYVPEVACRKTRMKRRTHGKRGNNESSIVDKEDILIDDEEHFNDKYQFATDLKTKDSDPGELILKYIPLSN